MPLIPNQLHCIQNSAHEVLGTTLGTLTMPVFTLKSFILFINHWSIVFRLASVYLQPLFVTHVSILEGFILISLIRCLDLLYFIFVWTLF